MESHRERGKAFQLRAKKAVESLLKRELSLDVPLPIGNPPKNHDFDFATVDRSYVGEAKAYTWTGTRNVQLFDRFSEMNLSGEAWIRD